MYSVAYMSIEFVLMARDSCPDSTRMVARWRHDITTRTVREFNHYLQCNLYTTVPLQNTQAYFFVVTIARVRVTFNGLRMFHVDGRLVASDACAMRRKKVFFTVSG